MTRERATVRGPAVAPAGENTAVAEDDVAHRGVAHHGALLRQTGNRLRRVDHAGVRPATDEDGPRWVPSCAATVR